ncbi:HAD-IC family P-type ATPase [Luteimicrobium xylanilyticum]|uniref:Putative cation-transporting ATPase n=1 Tax=Luteimicrobium xylanilyticum TaxID=1133546 RepID=A0A5P9QAR2_9MICO|nr:HAD-IC family P-type ATPase [Luteimicrobium xylanilyticum]QFU98449.1 putative cation-transporting ATPase [Luteimicrobium xylanilyticum]
MTTPADDAPAGTFATTPTAPAEHPAPLTDAQVAERVAAGHVNHVRRASSRSLGAILRANVLTLFNLILAIAAVLVLATGSWPDAVFAIVMVVNAGIGIATEYRAKRTLDHLSLLTESPAHVRRTGPDGVHDTEVALADIVLDDLLLLVTGDQVPADGTVLEVAGLEVDESMLTGESRSVRKQPGDEVLSGSVIVAGSATVHVTAVGADSYAQRIATEARRFSVARSELRDGINKVLAVVSVAIVPIALLLAWSQLRATGGLTESISSGAWRQAVVAAVAGVVGMIPEGLVLLTSLNFALAAILLARQGVLVQELPAVEVLARVDVLCLDKTGTITDGTVGLRERHGVLPDDAGDGREAAALGVLAALAADPGANATALAAGEDIDEAPAAVTDAVPFSSARKWSAVRTAERAYVLGGPDILLAGRDDDAARDALALVREAAGTGSRVVLLAEAPAGLPDPEHPLPHDLVPAVVCVLGEHVRPDAEQTLAYFHAQGVRTIVISGDDPETVGAIATGVRSGGPEQGEAPLVGYDARQLPAVGDVDGQGGKPDADQLAALADVLDEQGVYGRVRPEQKRAIVHALQSRGHVVGMTGDGVNDALALKDADLGIAMGNGAPATKAVARLVLVDGRFSTLPGVVGQGRRVMANMERVAGLFLTKTTYAALLAVAVVLLAIPYPFLPRHLTLVSSLTIGIPAFFLALPPNDTRYVPGFLRRVLTYAVPSGVVIGAGVLTAYLVSRGQGDPTVDARSVATLVLLALALWVLGIAARPWNRGRSWRLWLVVAMAACGAGAWAIPFTRDFFALELLNGGQLALAAVVVVVGWTLIEIAFRLIGSKARHPAIS